MGTITHSLYRMLGRIYIYIVWVVSSELLTDDGINVISLAPKAELRWMASLLDSNVAILSSRVSL